MRTGLQRTLHVAITNLGRNIPGLDVRLLVESLMQSAEKSTREPQVDCSKISST